MNDCGRPSDREPNRMSEPDRTSTDNSSVTSRAQRDQPTPTRLWQHLTAVLCIAKCPSRYCQVPQSLLPSAPVAIAKCLGRYCQVPQSLLPSASVAIAKCLGDQ